MLKGSIGESCINSPHCVVTDRSNGVESKVCSEVSVELEPSSASIVSVGIGVEVSEDVGSVYSASVSAASFVIVVVVCDVA